MPFVLAEDKRKWLMLGFAFLATVINYLDRQTLSVLAPVLLEQLQISANSYSHIIFAFMLAYTLMNGVSGRLLDWLGTKVGYALTIAFWSAAELLHTFTAGAFSLGMFRFLLGAGEAGNYPAGVRLIAEWFSPQERSHASGIFNSGASIGAILAPPLIAAIALFSGWRTTFIVVGLSGFLWLAAWFVLYRDPPSRNAEAPMGRLPFSTLLRSRFLWQFTLSKALSDPVWYFYTFWFPQYLKVIHGFSLREIGETAWIPFFTATLGNLAGGLLFSRLSSMGASTPTARRIAVLCFSALMLSAVFVGNRSSAILCIALISTATFGYSGALANLLAVPADVFPKGAVASVWGFASMGSGFGGMIFSLVTGWLVDHYSFRPVFLLFGVIPIISAWLVWTLPREAHLPVPEPA
jgi:ACS family hexuronate transporter-like MFS transporter